jgi:hypothetical protein
MPYRSSRLFMSIAACLLLAVTGCGDDDGAGQSPPATIPRDNFPAPVQRAIETAAADAGVLASEAGLISVEEVEWNDTGLGCPESGAMYAQVITPGFNVRLLIDGNEREYHTDMDSAVVRCDD